MAVVPTGQKQDPLLGPLDLPVKAGALTRVFAIGQPENGSMDAVVQVLPVGKARVACARTASMRVRPDSSPGSSPPRQHD